MKKNKWCVFLQKVTGVGLAILFYCGAPIEPAAAAIVLSIVELDLVTAGAAYVVVSATGRATGADSVTTGWYNHRGSRDGDYLKGSVNRVCERDRLVLPHGRGTGR